MKMFEDMMMKFSNLSDAMSLLVVATALFGLFLIYAIACIIFNKGVCPVPSVFMFGYWGSSPLPFLIFVSYDYRHHDALLAHEREHQTQQRRDGVLTFWYNYLTDKQKRQDYEVEAYRTWVRVAPNDLSICISSLINGYGFDLTYEKARELLT